MEARRLAIVALQVLRTYGMSQWKGHFGGDEQMLEHLEMRPDAGRRQIFRTDVARFLAPDFADVPIAVVLSGQDKILDLAQAVALKFNLARDAAIAGYFRRIVATTELAAAYTELFRRKQRLMQHPASKRTLMQFLRL